ncbi:anti-sigma factor [Massilia pinisoli]|uniref:Anti-sigma factor n=1 Tax=Massilia pinisoli TaxID=1772194 RepID=A0ABT1ZRN0_9BURK|nr:anti-sigma factor [Massilia pinisoli]MCS0582565.1 anti-sigma factor [Massilia pinisoli]
MNIQDNPALREKLAAEYVLGTLRGGARRRFERRLATDAALRNAVAGWQARIVPMAEWSPVTPPARAWDGIERRLGFARAVPAWQFWRIDGARLWGSLAVGGGVAAVVLAVVLAGRVQEPQLQQVATLVDDKAQTALVVAADARRARIDVRVADTVKVPDDRTLQLWAITAAGKTRSLGILPDNRHASLRLDQRAVGPDVVLLAISLEPKGGSPDPNAPTGPVLYKGAWVKL